MPLMDSFKNVIGKFMANPYDRPGQDTVATMYTGERRGYRPEALPRQPRRANQFRQQPEQNDAFVPNQPYAQQFTGAQQSSEQYARQFTGAQAPVYEQQFAASQAAPQQATGFGTSIQGRPATKGKILGFFDRMMARGNDAQQPENNWQQPQQATGWQQPAQPQQATGWQQTAQPQQATGWQQPAQPQQVSGWQQPAQPQQVSGWQQPEQPVQVQQPVSSWQQYNQQQEMPMGYNRGDDANAAAGRRTARRRAGENGAGNVLYMNTNNFMDDTGTAYSMVMRVAQPLSTATCYRIIEFLRNGESVLLNTEMIKDATELTRCLDLLFGAAYAMHYCYTRIASRSIYLITPAAVKVMPYASVNDLHLRDNARNWPGSEENNPYDSMQSMNAEGERRVSGMGSRRFGDRR